MRNSTRHILSVALTAGLVVFALGSGKSSGGGASGGGASKVAAKIGDNVSFDDSDWTTVDAKDLGKTMKPQEPAFEKPANTAGRFIQVHFKVTNKGKKEETLLTGPKIVDAKDREFGTYENQMEYIPKDTHAPLLETLQPSVQKEYYSIYEVPADATGLKLKIQGFSLFGDAKTVDLGL
jgi:hypothetical protein